MQIQTYESQVGQSHFGIQGTIAPKKNFVRANYSTSESRTALVPQAGKTPISQSIETLSNASLHRENNYTSDTFQTALLEQNSTEPKNTKPDNTSDEYNFSDVIDIINPLHHIPLINILYRGVSGDEIKPASQIIGGAIFSGPVGAASAVVNTVIEHETGHDITGNAIALVTRTGIQSITHDGIAETFDYSASLNPENRTVQTGQSGILNDVPQKIYNFNKAHSSYTARQNYADRYNG